MSPEIITVLYVNGSVEEVGFSENILQFSGVKYTGTKSKDTVVYSAFVNDLKTIYYLLYRQTQKYNLQIDSNQL